MAMGTTAGIVASKKLILEEFFGGNGEVIYSSKSPKTGIDSVTKERYIFNQYSFNVFWDGGYNIVMVNSDDGWFD